MKITKGDLVQICDKKDEISGIVVDLLGKNFNIRKGTWSNKWLVMFSDNSVKPVSENQFLMRNQ
jgi:hypothetical protein